jgi:cytidyltransferase-like protein
MVHLLLVNPRAVDMFVTELFPPTKDVVVVYPGRFQPFHKGHKAVYEHLSKTYGASNVFICTSNKVEEGKSPFNFQEKLAMMEYAGILKSQVIQSSQPYRAQEILEHYDPNNTILLIAVSEKDMTSNPRFTFETKKDGSPSYFQPLPESIKKSHTYSTHGYIVTVPTFEFKVLNKPMLGASDLRQFFLESNDLTRQDIVKDLYGRFNKDIYDIINSKYAS